MTAAEPYADVKGCQSVVSVCCSHYSDDWKFFIPGLAAEKRGHSYALGCDPGQKEFSAMANEFIQYPDTKYGGTATVEIKKDASGRQLGHMTTQWK